MYRITLDTLSAFDDHRYRVFWHRLVHPGILSQLVSVIGVLWVGYFTPLCQSACRN